MTTLATRIQRVSAMLAAVLSLGFADPAGAQTTSTVNVVKQLCSPTPCPSTSVVSSVALNDPVQYQIALANNTTGSLTVNLQETIQPGFVITGATCNTNPVTTLTATPPVGIGGGPTSLGPVTLPPGTGSAPGPTVTCTISGYYTPTTGVGLANNVATVVNAGTGAVVGTSNPVNATVNPQFPMASDLAISKTASAPSINVSTGAQTVTYTITVKNNGPNPVNLGPNFRIQDQVSIPATGVPLQVTFVSSSCQVLPANGGSTCPGQPTGGGAPVTVASTAGTDFLTWIMPAGGVINPGDSIVITVVVTINQFQQLAWCKKTLNGNGLNNTASMSFTTAGMSSLNDANPANNTASVSLAVETGAATVDPTCGDYVRLRKRLVTPQPPGGFAWNTSLIEYKITLTNVSQQQISNLQINDLVQQPVGTPNFWADIVSVTCHPGPLCPNGTAPPNTQSLNGYLDTEQIYHVGPPSVSLPPNTTVDIDIVLRYRTPSCTAYPTIERPPINNIATASFNAIPLGGTTAVPIDPVSTFVTVYMQRLDPCPLKVTKALSGNPAPTQIQFGQPVSYNVTFANTGAAPITIGTLIDTLRLTTGNYAVQLPVDYTFTCTSTTGVTGFPASGSGTAMVSNSALPQQGVQIIHNTTPVVFPADSSVTCTVTVTVRKPLEGDPFCSLTGSLQNSAIMDVAGNYNPNLPWPQNALPDPYDSKTLPLPHCYDFVVNKRVIDPPAPPWVTQNAGPNGGPIKYEIVVANHGDAIGPGTNIPQLTDVFNQNTATILSVQCSPPTPACAYAWAPSPTTLQISALAKNQSIVITVQLPGPYKPPPGQVCNDATVGMSKVSADPWYWKHPDTLATNTCVPVFDARPLEVTKVAVNKTPGPLPATTFQVSVSCSLNGIPYGPNQTLTFNVPPLNPPMQVVEPIPVGSTCVVVEAPKLPAADPSCPSGFAAWQQPAAQNVIIGTAKATQVALTNVLECVPPVPLQVRKQVIVVPPAVAPPTAFTINVACTFAGQAIPIAPVTLNTPPNAAQQLLQNLPLGAVCSITEQPPASHVPSSKCPTGFGTWDPPAYVPQSLTLVSTSLNRLEARNTFRCEPAISSLTVIKRVVVGGSQSFANVPFAINVVCTQGTTTTVTTTVTLTGATSPMSQIVPNIPIGSTCTVSEPPPAPLGGWQPPCRWLTTYPNPIGPDQTTKSVTIAGGSNQLVVLNEELCDPVSTAKHDPILVVKKTVTINGAYNYGAWTTMSFPMTVQCVGAGLSSGPPFNLSPANNYRISGPVLSLNATCTVTEGTLPPLPSNLASCDWVKGTPTYLHAISGQGYSVGPSIVLASAQEQYILEVRNDLTCPPGVVPLRAGGPGATAPPAGAPQPVSCRAPRTPNATGTECVCPRGTVARGPIACVPQVQCRTPMIANAAGNACVCPTGMRQVGQRCVPPIACNAPMIANAAGNACVCPAGMRQLGQRCLPPITCNAPMIPNAAGNACVCPAGMRQLGRRCLPRLECHAPMIANPAGTECVCPAGMVQRERSCVPATVCVPPARLNRRGICECPEDMVMRGNTCIERERRPPASTPGGTKR